MPDEIGATAMSEREVCEPCGVTAQSLRAGVRVLCKGGVLREYEIKRTIRISGKCNMEVYNLETIIALAFRIGTFGAERVRNAVLERLYLRKEKTNHLPFAEWYRYSQARISFVEFERSTDVMQSASR